MSERSLSNRAAFILRCHQPIDGVDVDHPVTPDGHYFVVRGRLWRCSNPNLPASERELLTHEWMSARRAKQTAMRSHDLEAREEARVRIDAAKVALGERGAVWWNDGIPDLNRRVARTTCYAAWFAALVD
jgi:hypothetical protein